MKSNILYIYNKVFRAALYMLCMVSLFSCVKVDLCTAEEHPHTGNLKVVYHWPEDGFSHPDSMLVLVNRIVNTRRVGYVTGKETSVGGRYRFGKVYQNEDAAVSGGLERYPLQLGAGEYQVFAFNNDIADINKGDSGMDSIADYRFDKIEEYSDGQHIGTVGIRDLAISYVGRELTDPGLYLYGKDWVDNNDYGTKYIATEVKPIYRATNKRDELTQEYTVSIRANEKVEIDLYPQKITQDITFAFPVYTECAAGIDEDLQVKIDSIIAEISGIPHKMMLYSGELSVDTTYKMLFKMGMDEENAKEVMLKVEKDGHSVNKKFIKTECMSTISVIGLVTNKDTTALYGPGILQLCIYAHASEYKDGIKVDKTKTLYSKIRMYNIINNANLLIRNEFGKIVQNPGAYEELPRTDTLRIDDIRVKLMRDEVLNASDDDNPIDNWGPEGDGEDNNLEIEL